MTLFHDLCYSIAELQLLLEFNEFYSSVLQNFNFVMSIVICIVGLVGNAGAICFIGLIMKKHKSKYWFLNLAIADFLTLLTLPLHAIVALKGTWPFGPHMCKLFIFSVYVSMYPSVIILVALNIARVLSVAQPMFHLKFMTQSVSYWICTLIWFITAVFSLPVFYYSGEVKVGEVKLCNFMGSRKTFATVVVNTGYNMSSENSTRDILVSNIYTKFNPFFEQCSSDTCCGGEETLDFWNHIIFTSKWFVIPYLTVGYFIPVVIIIICNVTIVVNVKKSKTMNTHRLYRIVFLIVLFHFITWTPAVIAEAVLFIAVLNKNLMVMFSVRPFMPLLANIACTNLSLNPVLYVLSGGKIRTKLSDFISNIRTN